jgi:hypothetical protein
LWYSIYFWHMAVSCYWEAIFKSEMNLKLYFLGNFGKSETKSRFLFLSHKWWLFINGAYNSFYIWHRALLCLWTGVCKRKIKLKTYFFGYFQKNLLQMQDLENFTLVRNCDTCGIVFIFGTCLHHAIGKLYSKVKWIWNYIFWAILENLKLNPDTYSSPISDDCSWMICWDDTLLRCHFAEMTLCWDDTLLWWHFAVMTLCWDQILVGNHV